jgi:phenylalanine-4-hydroxylase
MGVAEAAAGTPGMHRPSGDAPHPGTVDPGYLARRAEIAAISGSYRPGLPVPRIVYTAQEDATWRVVQAELDAVHRAVACRAVLDAKAELGLPADRVPQLDEVSARLGPRTGFRFRPVPGLVPKEEFFAHLAAGEFLSTQYVRHPAVPLYTPEPDVVHEVIGHATTLAVPELAELHRLAGRAVATPQLAEARQHAADVFWFSGEFGVVREAGGWKAYGAGLLSSAGELRWFRGHAEVRPLDPTAMAAQPYDITRYQPVLFGADSLAHLLDVAGRFFAEFDDDRYLAALAAPARTGGTP